MRASLLFLLFISSLQTALASDTQVCVIDDSNRQVCLPKAAGRIISLSAAVTELIFSAGAGRQLIAVDDNSNFPEQVNDLPAVASYNSINEEIILTLNPDLIVLWEIATPQIVNERLKTLRIPIFYANPTTVPAIAETVTKLGKLAQTEEAANKAANKFLKDYQQVVAQNQKKEHISFYFDLTQAPMMTINGNHIISVAIETCGAQNIYWDAVPPLPLTSRESLVARNPDAIVYAAGLNDLNPDFWQPLKTMKAVQNKAFIAVNPDILVRPTFRLLEGIKTICSALDQLRETKSTKMTPTP